MRWMSCITLAACLLALAGCNAGGTADGGGTENSSHARVKIGVPF